ncbi:MAG TPA: hypothetical protein ENF27_05405 [Chloroflexi bacterium]|nr:MAG: hypothetical protein DRI46_03710 [Chloroflexota bacterium]HDN05354.1 hypothetical protein [Chloroflexota bacterium]
MGKLHYLKLLGFWAGFLILHYAYDFFPILPLKLVSGINESFFQHIKIVFFTYLIVNLVEFLTRRKVLENRESYILTRLFSTTILPWFVFIIWFMAPAYYGPIGNVAVEILYANIALLLSGFCTLVIEQTMDGIPYHNLSKVVIIALFVISMSLYIIFTFKLPWADVFADPTAMIEVITI